MEKAELQTGTGLALADPVPPGAVVQISRAAAFLPAPWEDLEYAARMISTAPGLAIQFRRPEAAMFAAYQAARWRADPVAVASKMYFTGDGDRERVGYEAQLIHALVESDPDLLEPLQFDYGYAGNSKTAGNRFCKVTGYIRGASKPYILTTPTISQIKIKRSPLWFSDGDQQLAYYGSRGWARRFRPNRILGIYSSDELADVAREERIERPALFEEEDAEAEFGDGVEPTAADSAAYARWEAKASGEGDSRDPRDAKPNRAPEPPPETGPGDGEPADIPEVREWAAGEQRRILALADPAKIAAEWDTLITDRRFGRLKAYDSATAAALAQSVRRRIADIQPKDA